MALEWRSLQWKRLTYLITSLIPRWYKADSSWDIVLWVYLWSLDVLSYPLGEIIRFYSLQKVPLIRSYSIRDCQLYLVSILVILPGSLILRIHGFIHWISLEGSIQEYILNVEPTNNSTIIRSLIILIYNNNCLPSNCLVSLFLQAVGTSLIGYIVQLHQLLCSPLSVYCIFTVLSIWLFHTK